MTGNIVRDRELVDDIKNGKAYITHEVSERFAEDVKDAINAILDEYDELLFVKSEKERAEEHIEKLEDMLDRRNARYKKWEDVLYGE